MKALQRLKTIEKQLAEKNEQPTRIFPVHVEPGTSRDDFPKVDGAGPNDIVVYHHISRPKRDDI